MKDETDVIDVKAKDIKVGDEVWIHVSQYCGWEKVTGVLVTSNGKVKLTTTDGAYYDQERLFRVRKFKPVSKVKDPNTLEGIVQVSVTNCTADTVHRLAEAIYRGVRLGTVTVNSLEANLGLLLFSSTSKVA